MLELMLGLVIYLGPGLGLGSWFRFGHVWVRVRFRFSVRFWLVLDSSFIFRSRFRVRVCELDLGHGLVVSG